uniref:Uncharacterized protein n=1 Tax=Maylandia zebra TaxID=106582 RepID=A0A3P9CL53_9CICH
MQKSNIIKSNKLKFSSIHFNTYGTTSKQQSSQGACTSCTSCPACTSCTSCPACSSCTSCALNCNVKTLQ